MSGMRRIESACPESVPAGGSCTAAHRLPRRTVCPGAPVGSRSPRHRPVAPSTLRVMPVSALRVMTPPALRVMTPPALRAMTPPALRAMTPPALRAMTGRRRAIRPAWHVHAELTPMLNSRPC
jgi:hypothetical protein